MKILLCLVFVVGVSMAQRSPYAPRPVGYPDVLNRFKGDEDDLPNRVGGENSSSDQGPLQPQPGTIGDPYLVQRLPEWPREHQPFWYLNQQHILTHTGQNQGGQPNRQQGSQQQGSQQQGNRQQGGQAGRQQFGQPGQAGRQQFGQPGQAGRFQGTQQGNRQQDGQGNIPRQ